MTDRQARSLIEKLSRLTEDRGATKAEALCARKKMAELAATLTPRYQGLYVEGWPGQPVCAHTTIYRFGPHTICGVCRKQIIR